MNDQYLWDKTGEPDPETQNLENLLSVFQNSRGLQEPRKRRWPFAFAAAAVLLLGILAVWSQNAHQGPAWDVSTSDGRRGGDRRLHPGEWIETGKGAQAQLDLESFGQIVVNPDSRLKLAESRENRQRLELERGSLHATIWAPPGRFSVATPSATAVDLGCVYDLETDLQGNGLVRVEGGWVAFEDRGRESFIPAGALCKTSRGRGPGVPYFDNASLALKTLVDRFDLTGRTDGLGAALESSSSHDGVTLWHLLRRVPESERGPTYDRFAALLPVPTGVSRDGIIKGDRQMLDALWDSLGYGDADWWRTWKSRGPG